jgi:acyl carrier protein
MNMTRFESEVRQFIADKFLFGDDKKLGDDDSLLEAGIVDSTGILEIIAFLEERYKIKVETEELIPENLDSITSICAFLRKKTG